MQNLGLPDDSFRHALDEHAIIAITDRHGIILEVNEKFCQISGYSRDELIGKTHRLINSKRHSRAFFAEMWNIILSGNTWTGEVCNRKKNGSYYWLDATIVPIAGEDGAPSHFIAVRRDITDRKLQAMLDHSILENAGTSVIATDTQGIITLFNPGAELLLGYTEDEMVGKHTPEAFHDFTEVVVRAEELSKELGFMVRPGFEAFIAKARETRKPDVNDWTYIRKDRSTRIVSLSVTVLIDSLGHIEGYLGIASDVSELRQSVRQRQEFSNRLEKIASQVPGMVFQYRLNPDGTSCFPYVSEGIREVYQLCPQDVQTNSKPLLDRIHPDDLAMVMESIQQSYENLHKWQQEFRVIYPNGEVHWVYGSSIPERWMDGTTIWHGFTTDITERKADQDRIREASVRDPMTGLHNRLFADEELSRIRKGRRFPISVFMIDLDGLKRANDEYGHDAGDHLILATANLLRTCFRPEDLIVRMGGDEFLVVLPDSSPENTEQAHHRLRSAMESAPPVGNITLSMSIGGDTAMTPEDYDRAIKSADARMYQDKLARKKNRDSR